MAQKTKKSLSAGSPWYVLKLFGIFILFFILSSVIHVLSIGYFHHTWSPLMVIRNCEALGTNPGYSASQEYVVIDSISPNLILATLCAEDQKFTQHNGFDFEAMEKALKHNAKSKTKIGGSTISQQTAKNVFLWPGRNKFRKGLEAYYTLLIETFWSKKRILESYLNVIEMGDGIYGAEAASQHYFEKRANSLSVNEASRLATIYPLPRQWDPNHLDQKRKTKASNIRKFMRKYGFLLKDLGIKERK